VALFPLGPFRWCVCSQIFKRIVFAAAIAILRGPWHGYVLGEFGMARRHAWRTNRTPLTSRCASYAEVLRKVQNYYVTEPSIPDVTNGALHGTAGLARPDSSYLTPARVQAVERRRPATDTAQVGITVIETLWLRDDRECASRLTRQPRNISATAM